MSNPAQKPDFLLNKIQASNDLPKTGAELGGAKLRLNVAQAQASLNRTQAPKPTMPQEAELPLEDGWFFKALRFFLTALCVVWLCGWLAFSVPTAKTAADLGIAIAAGFSPVLMVGIWLSSLSRRREAALYAKSLQKALNDVLLPGETRSQMVEGELGLMLDQAAEITRTTRATMATLADMRESVREELREFANLTRLAEGHLVTLANEVQSKTESVQDLSTGLQNVLGTLSTSTEAAEGKLNAVVGALNTGASQLHSVAHVLDERLQTTAASTERMAEEINRLDTLITTQNNTMASTVAAMVEQVGTATAALEAGRTALNQETRALGESERQIAESLNEGTGRLARTTDSLLAAGSSVFGGVDARTAQLQTALLDWAELLKVHEHKNETSLNLVQTISGKLGEMGAVSDKTTQQVETLVSVLTASLQQFTEAGVHSSKKVSEISAMAEKLTEALRLSSLTLAERANQVESRVGGALQAVERVANGLDEKQTSLVDVLSRRTADLQTASEKVAELTENVRQELRKGMQEMANATGDIAARTSTISTQLGQHRGEVESIVAMADGKLADFALTLEKTTALMRQAANAQQTGATETSLNLEQTLAHIERAATTLQAATHEGTQSCTTAAEKLQKQAQDLRHTLREQATGIDGAAQKMLPQIEKAQNDATQLIRQLHALSQSSKTALGQISTDVQATQTTLDERFKQLNTSSADAAQQMRVVSELVLGSMDTLNNAASGAESKVRQLNTAIERQADTMHLMTDRYLSRVEQTQKQIDEGFKDLSAAIGASVSSLEGAGQSFTRQINEAENNAGKIIQVLGATGDKAKLETGQILAQVGLLQSTMSKLTEQAANQQEKLMEGSDKATLSMRQNMKELDENLATVQYALAEKLAGLQNAIQNAQQQAQQASGVGVSAVSTVSGALKGLNESLKTVEETVSKAQNALTQSSTQFLGEAETFTSKTMAAVNNTSQVAHELGRSGLQLDTLLARLTENSAALKQHKMDIERDAFLSSSRFVFESLHTLSVDLTRGVEGDMPQKAWRAYEKGDITALTKRLASMVDHLPMDKIRGKIATDADFRTHTQRYTRLFEELFEQALSTERGVLLAAGLLTSDIGGIYTVLCDAMGRTAKRLPS